MDEIRRDYAVVTGDIIASTRLLLGERKKLYEVMKESSIEVEKVYNKSIPLPAQIFSGDSWQILISEPWNSLRIALFYRALLRAKMETHRINTRMAIAIGEVDFVPKDRVSEGYGQAYSLSGRTLSSIPKSSNMQFVYPKIQEAHILNIIVQLIDTISSKWSDKQALAVTGALQQWTQEKIGASLWEKNISQQAVAQHLSRAGWYSVEQGLLYFEKTLSNRNK